MRAETSLRAPARGPAAGRLLLDVALALGATFVVAGALVHAAEREGSLYDAATFLRAAAAVASGESPYPEHTAPVGDDAYAYPPVLALLLAPLTALPDVAAQVAFVVASLAALLAAFALLGVRDPRCHAAALCGAPVVNTLYLGTVGLLLLVPFAAAWRLRARTPGWAGAALGLGVVLKPFLWPLLAWPLAVRRWALLAAAAVAGLLACLLAWGWIGFAELTEYPELVRELTRLAALESYSVAALAGAAGASLTAGSALGLAAAAALLVVALRATDERVALTLCCAAALAATPILWFHYLTLLLVPIALARPRFGPIWLAPVALFALDAPAWSGGDALAVGAVLAATGAILAWCAFALSSARGRPAGTGTRASSSARSRTRPPG